MTLITPDGTHSNARVYYCFSPSFFFYYFILFFKQSSTLFTRSMLSKVATDTNFMLSLSLTGHMKCALG